MNDVRHGAPQDHEAATFNTFANEERLRLATEHAEIGFWDVDEVNQQLVWPPIVKAMFGISADVPVTMQDFYDGLHPADREATAASYAAAADPARRALYDVEYRTIGKEDGVVRWVAAKGRGVFDADGRCLRVIGTAIDITQRKAAEVRQRVLLRLDDAIRDVSATGSISFIASALLGEALDAIRVGYGVIDKAKGTIRVERNWSAAGFVDVAGLHQFGDYGSFFGELRAGKPVAVSNVAEDPRTSSKEQAFRTLGIMAHLDVPVIEDGEAVAEMFVHSSVPRNWSEDEISFVREVAERTHAAIARRAAEQERRETEARFRAVFDSDLIGLTIFDFASRTTETINNHFLQMTGHTRADFDEGRWDWRDFTIPEFLPLDEAAISQAQERGWWDPYEKYYRALDGRRFPVRISSAPMPGFPTKVVVSVEDITERKRWEEHQRLLIGELNHRVKNSLAIVQSLAHQTFPRDAAMGPYLAAYEKRLSALAATHNLLTRANWASADLHDLIAESLRLIEPDPTRVSLTGPPVALTPQAAVSLSMAVHELATNALKYGALSGDSGSVVIQWQATADEFFFIWEERDGPKVMPPQHRGFGSRMIERALSSALDAQVELRFDAVGVRCLITAPSSNFASIGQSQAR